MLGCKCPTSIYLLYSPQIWSVGATYQKLESYGGPEMYYRATQTDPNVPEDFETATGHKEDWLNAAAACRNPGLPIHVL